jgi:hypothetical protein
MYMYCICLAVGHCSSLIYTHFVNNRNSCHMISKGKYIVNISEIRWKLWIWLHNMYVFDLWFHGLLYTFLQWSHFLLFLRVEHWGGRVGVTYATCMTVSDLMWILLLNVHSFIQNNKLCTLRKTYVDLKSQI